MFIFDVFLEVDLNTVIEFVHFHRFQLFLIEQSFLLSFQDEHFLFYYFVVSILLQFPVLLLSCYKAIFEA
jgi:hypothetical protein